MSARENKIHPHQAMLFAAGLGTRLQPLTNDRPKALVEVGGLSLLAHQIQKLKFFGIKHVVVNVHHFADLVIQYLEERNHFGLTITISDERDLLLDTGGGLKKAMSFFDDEADILVCNVDILSDLNLNLLYQHHSDSKALATLAVRRRDSSRYLFFNAKNTLCGWTNTRTQQLKMARRVCTDPKAWAFSGIHIISKRLADYFPPDQAVFSIIDTYLKAAATETIQAYPHDDTQWMDVGRYEHIDAAESVARQLRATYHY